MRVSRSLSRPIGQAMSMPSASWAVGAPVLRQSSALPSRALGRQAGLCFSFNATTRYTPFSTSARLTKEGEAEQKKQEENKAAGEAMGAQDGKSAEAGGGESSKALEELQASIKEKDARIKELTDAVLYGKADLQNAQRRAQEEKSQASDYAITKFARDLTSSLDILNLALRSVPEQLRTAPSDVTSLDDPRKAIAELYSGVELTSKSILDMLKMHGVTIFDPTGEKFDPQEHEAMFQAPVPGKEPGTVLECSKVGFRIKDRILRAAQVGVVQETN